MQLDQWSGEGLKSPRNARLAIGGLIGIVAVGGIIGFALTTASEAEAELPEEDVLEVAFVAEEEPLPVMAEPEPIEAEAEAAPVVPASAPRLNEIRDIDTIPDQEAEQSDATDSGSGDPYADAGSDDIGSNYGSLPDPQPVAPPPPPPPPPPKKKKPAGPVPVTENVTPPQPISMGSPAYPAAARASNIEGVVIVRYVVTESGTVTGVQAVRGPAQLQSACVSAVKAWRFKPAMLDGKAISVSRVAKFPFRIRT